MSAAAAQVTDAVPATPAKGKKKLLIIIVAALVVVLAGGGGTVFYLKKKAAAAAAAAEAEDGDAPAAHAEAKGGKHDVAQVPTFLPLEPFVVNLADKDADRYAQIGITLEIDDAKFADQLKAYMPAIRNGILMVLAHKTSAELLERSGKVALAAEIMREAVRPVGIELDDPAVEPKADAKADDDEGKVKKKPKKKAPAPPNPLRHVHFSNFIIQ
jgi:flagellar FliL protein